VTGHERTTAATTTNAPAKGLVVSMALRACTATVYLSVGGVSTRAARATSLTRWS
jgi:hypothetical protein